MKNVMLILGMMIIISACHSNHKIEYKLSDERMAQLMLDLQLAEVTLPDMSPGQQDSIKQLFNKKLEEIYHLTSDDIEKEMELLRSDPKKMKLILDRAKQMADSIQ